MTLDECVRKQPKRKCLYVGAASGYVFIGNVKQYEAEIDRIDADLRNSFKKVITSVSADLACAVDKVAHVDDAEQKLSYWGKVENRMAAIDAITKRALAYKCIRTREVREVYDMENGRMVLIEGNEKGDFWFKDEYDKAYRKGGFWT